MHRSPFQEGLLFFKILRAPADDLYETPRTVPGPERGGRHVRHPFERIRPRKDSPAMVTNDEILSQDDVDALLEGAGSGDEKPSQAAAPAEEPERKIVQASSGRSASEALNLLAGLCKKAMVQRDRDVRVIWNAHGLFPLTPGYNMEIQGRTYVSLGSLSNSHLVVGLTDG